MAEPLVSGVLEQLAFITTDLALKEVRLIKDVDKNISSLKKKLELIQAVLEDAERKQLGDAAVRSWLKKLTDVSYDIDDVLDEWRYEILIKSEIQKQMEAEENDHQKAKKKVCLPLIPSSSCFCINQLKQLGVRRDIAHRIKKLNETLEEIAKERHDYSLETTKTVQRERRETSSVVDHESQFYGVDGPKNALIEKLLNESSEGPDGKLGPAIIPIKGMGGLGKTTLAKFAFNDEKIKTHFHERIWACVSDPFDEIKIAKAIIESLEDSHPNLETLEALFQRIRKHIEGKKFFLVLDDVWTEDREKWENFIQPFRYGAVGSRVLVTTRKMEVVNMMGAATQMIPLELLSKEHCWSIFSGIAFRGRNSEESKKLERVGREIAERYCKGLPLAAKTLGRLMCSKHTEREWKDVLSSRIWQIQDEKIETFAAFFLSYYDLSPRERRCFSYCSVFPKDYNFRVDELIGLWMSQGYFSGSENAEKEGEKCFQILTMRSFFQDFQRDIRDGSIVGCKMHDILHDFAQFLTRNECSTISVDMEKTDLEPPLSIARHSTLLLPPNFPKIPTLISDQSNMRSLFIITTSHTSSDDENMVLFHQTCLYRKHLRTLYLRKCQITKVPKQIGQLIHLRYLNLSGNRNLRELPDEVCDLFNLQTLNIRECWELQSLPKGMGKLVNLRHLYNSWCVELKGLPKEIGRLTQLRTLERMIIPENNYEVMYLSLEDLKRLNHLRYQRLFEIVNCSNLISLGEIEESVLGNWEGLVALSIDFGDIGGEQIYKDEFRILEALQPHPSLIILGIGSYKGTNLCPRWMMSLVNLRRLFLSNCNHCETLHPLGSLPSLKELVLVRLAKVRKIGAEFLGTKQGIDDDINVRMVPLFPKLESFTISLLEELEEWEGDVIEPTGDASGAIMPCLNEIKIGDCDRLKSLPEYLKLTPLKKITIFRSKMLSESLQHSEKEWHKISHILTIIINGRTVRSDGKWDSDESAKYCVPRALLHNENEDDLDDNSIEQ